MLIDKEKSLALSDLSELSSLSGIENFVKAPSIPSCSTDPKVSLESLFYWQCYQCCENNLFTYKNCKTCSLERNQSPASALLKLAEVAAKTSSTYEAAVNNLPINQRDCIPSSVLLACMERNSKKEADKIDGRSLQDAVDYFYWNCGFCTMKNSFKIHTCKCCNQKVR